MLHPGQSVADIVSEFSECASVFQRHRIDYCCHGSMSLATACGARNLDVQTLLEELEQAISERVDACEDSRSLSTAALIRHIEHRYHHSLRKTLPFVEKLSAKVGRVHGDRNPRLRELEAVVRELNAALIPHLDREEQELFPALTARSPADAVVRRELSEMLEEHRSVGRLLLRMRGAAENFQSPAWACNSYRTLMTELEHLEGDILRHVYLENHVLMPRFIPAELARSIA